jgi:di/tricarboxylate transporter
VLEFEGGLRRMIFRRQRLGTTDGETIQMTFEIGLLLGLIAVGLVCFSFDWVPADVVGLGLLLALVLTGILKPAQAFAGFGSDTVMMIFGLLVMTVGLTRAGIVDLVGRTLVRVTGKHPQALILMIMIAVTGLSAFISNTAATAFFVPIAIGVANRVKMSPSLVLLPLAFSSILSSSITLISTSTNLVVSGLMVTSGLAPMGMFELAPVGLPITIAGLLYVYFIGRRLLPARERPTELIESFGVRPFLTEVMVLPNSPWIGKTLEEAGLGSSLDLTVLEVLRNQTEHLLPTSVTTLQSGDILIVEGPREEVLKIKDVSGIEIRADVKFSNPSLQSADTALVEAILLPRSPLIGRTLRKAKFRERYGVQVLAMNRHGRNVISKISQVTLHMGDVLLLQGHKNDIAALRDDPAFRILGAVDEPRFDRRRAILSVGIFTGALLLGVLKILALPVAVLLGAFCTLLTKCISPEEAYRELEWRVVILIACMLSLGAAMDVTGADKYLAGLVVDATRGIGPVGLLAGFFILTVLLTQPMSNQAAAAVLLPVAIETANQIGVNARTFAMMVAVAASCSYLTPLEPSCLLVYGPGRYRFSDFLRVGAGLTILIFVIALFLVPRVWPLH